MSSQSKSSGLEQRLNIKFTNRDLIERALTHSSARRSPENNERLEFLGDRVLGLVIAEHLFELHPEAEEGELAKRFNALVRREACTKVARSIELGQYLYLGSGQDGQDGRDNTSILADACEALLGAIFIDQGYGVARDVIRAEWTVLLRAEEDAVRDPKSSLQEWAQGRGLALPRYEMVSVTGPDHAPEFTIRVFIEGMEPAEADGPSKRQTEQSAAKLMLCREEFSKGGKS